jgi:hypothetical protein
MGATVVAEVGDGAATTSPSTGDWTDASGATGTSAAGCSTAMSATPAGSPVGSGVTTAEAPSAALGMVAPASGAAAWSSGAGNTPAGTGAASAGAGGPTATGMRGGSSESGST